MEIKFVATWNSGKPFQDYTDAMCNVIPEVNSKYVCGPSDILTTLCLYISLYI